MQKSFQGRIRTSLRSQKNCFKVSNLFRNQKKEKLSQNIEFIPKHVLRKIQQKQILTCKDIVGIQVQIEPFRSSTDIFTVKMARKMQQKYKQNVDDSNNGQIKPPSHEKPVQQYWQHQNKMQIPTGKSLI